MNPAEMNTEAGRQLGLPMMTIFSVRSRAGRAVAHALDFDLVATAPTSKEALHKLRAAVKHHIEFGFKRTLCKNDIELKAPQECWDKMVDAPLTLGEDIEIDHHRIRTMTRTDIDETETSLTTA
jgi:hypothetical protein